MRTLTVLGPTRYPSSCERQPWVGGGAEAECHVTALRVTDAVSLCLWQPEGLLRYLRSCCSPVEGESPPFCTQWMRKAAQPAVGLRHLSHNRNPYPMTQLSCTHLLREMGQMQILTLHGALWALSPCGGLS